MTTLRRVLTQSKAEVPCKTKASKNSTGDWPLLDPWTTTSWDDFNLNTLNESYGHILDREIPAEQLEAPRAEHVLQGIEIAKPDDILHLIGWKDQLLRPTLAFAKRHLGLHSGVHLQHSISAADRSSFASISTSRLASLRADHRVALDDFPLPNLVVGLGRPSTKFQGRRLLERPEAAGKGGFLPLRQLANLCALAKTRYGYILTDQDLVACCFYKRRAGAGQAAELSEAKGWKVAMMPVPWTRYGETQLTTDIALWWLSMLALSAPENRALVAEADVVGIGEWERRYLDEERGWVRRHRYSNVEEPTDPPSPPAYRTPSPGNRAAFEAAVGFHIDPNFDINPNFDFNPNFAIDPNNLLFNHDNNALFNPNNAPVNPNNNQAFGQGDEIDFNLGPLEAFLHPDPAQGSNDRRHAAGNHGQADGAQ